MNTIDSATLANMTINMLERTAMVVAEVAVNGRTYPEPTRFARISYRGPSEGTLVLAATDDFLCELAAGILGVSNGEVDVESHGCDALKEMANIVCGSMILALSGEICEYSLGLPSLSKSPLAVLTDNEKFPGDIQVSCAIVSDDRPLRIEWRDASRMKDPREN